MRGVGSVGGPPRCWGGSLRTREDYSKVVSFRHVEDIFLRKLSLEKIPRYESTCDSGYKYLKK